MEVGVWDMNTEKIRIPDNMHPWRCNVNGVTYIYQAGAEVEETNLPPEPEPSDTDELTDAEALDILLGGAT